MSQVPGESAKLVPSREEQLKWLWNRLAGHEAFGRWRGRLGAKPFGEFSITDLMRHLLAFSGSPTVFCAKWDAEAGCLREMGNILAQLQRDGWKDAEEEFWCALRDPAHLIEGEVVPLSKMRPLTLVICDATVTLDLIRLLVEGQESDFQAVIRGAFGGAFARAERVLAGIPELRASIQNPSQCARGRGPIFRAYQDHVNNGFKTIIEMAPIQGGHLRYWRTSPTTIQDSSDCPQVAFLLCGEQGEVLARFSREQQESFATWQFHFPIALMPGLNHYWIGVHPEACHTEWQAGFCEPRPWPSAGFSYGLGAVLLPQNAGCPWNFSDAPPYHERYKGQGLAFALW